MIDLPKLIAQADHHIKGGDGMHMDPQVVKELALAAHGQLVVLQEMEQNDQRWRHFLGFLSDSDRAVDFHERFPSDRVPTPEEYVAAIDADRAAYKGGV